MPYYHELLLFHTGGELTCTIARPPPPPFPPSLVPIFFPTPPYLPQPMQPSPSVYNLPSCRFNFHAALKDP